MHPGIPQHSFDDAPAISVAHHRFVATPEPSTLPAAFAQTVRAHGGKVAVIDGAARRTYDELDRLSDATAAQLAARGVVRGDRVGIFMERSTAALVAMLAVVKLGAAFVPFEPAAPAQRLATQARAAGIRVLLVANAGATPGWHTGEALVVDLAAASPAAPLPAPGLQPPDLAYVIYTSGSTNEPKGVCATHRGVVDLVAGADYCGFVADDVVHHGMSIAFDGSTFEIWGALLTGATLVVAPPRLSAREIADLVEAHGTTVLLLSTGVFNALDATTLRRLRNLRVLLAGGDVMSPLVANAFLAAGGRVVVNGYGPTEITTFSHCHVMTAPDDAPVPIGVPVPGTSAYVLDEHLAPVRLGVEGELYIAGTGLAQGYLGNPALTAERFVPDPFAADGSRMYRTGDLVRQGPGGRLDYVGRIDTQVKIRGFRVELAEIETCLRTLGSLSDACVIHARHPSGTSALHAYAVASAAPHDDAAVLLARLRDRLPDYMVPRRLVFADALPLTVNGKVDRRRLAAEAATAYDADEPGADHADALARSLLGTLARLVGRPHLAASDNFFDVGGDSLAAMRFCAAVGEQHGVSLPMAVLFDTDTLEQLIAEVRSLKNPPVDTF